MDFDFRDQIQATDWYPLEIHYNNSGLFLISAELELEVVAKAVAGDDSAQVEMWLKDNQIFRPEPEQVEVWRKDPYQKIGDFIIVAPYVFLKLHQK